MTPLPIPNIRELTIESIRESYRAALDTQEAETPAEVINAFPALFEAARRDMAMHSRRNARIVRKHPVMVLVSSKLHSLAGLSQPGGPRYDLAYDFAEQVADESLFVGSEVYREALEVYFGAYNAS